MNLFARKVRTICMCNVMVPFVCTGFLGTKVNTGIFIGSTTNEAHEISLTASDTEPASQCGEGDSKFAFITDGIEAVIDQQQDFTGPRPLQGEENDFAFITKSVGALINQQESALAEKKVETKKTTKTTTKKTTTKKTTSTNTRKKTTTTSVVQKKEVASSNTYEKPGNTSKTGEAIVAYAKKFKGLRYSSGSQSLKSGADCSGFTMLIYREFGISLPRTVGGQLSRGKVVSKSNLQKGDLVFFKKKGCSKCGASHVSIYIGGGQVIHETRPGRGVAITGIDGLSNIQFVGARRIINSSTASVAEKKTDKTASTPTPTPTVTATPTATPVVTATATPIINEEKNENVNNSVAATPGATTATATPVENKQEVKTDTPVEVKVEASTQPEVKVEASPAVVKEEKKEEPKKEEVVETPVSSPESN